MRDIYKHIITSSSRSTPGFTTTSITSNSYGFTTSLTSRFTLTFDTGFFYTPGILSYYSLSLTPGRLCIRTTLLDIEGVDCLAISICS